MAERPQTNISFFAVLGKEVKRYMDSGSFVPDDTMISLISNEIESVADRNWLLDGEWKGNDSDLVAAKVVIS